MSRLTWVEVNRAVDLGNTLRTLREAATILQEDRQLQVTIQVPNLSRTYGIMNNHTVTFPYDKARLLELIRAEEDRIRLELDILEVHAPFDA